MQDAEKKLMYISAYVKKVTQKRRLVLAGFFIICALWFELALLVGAYVYAYIFVGLAGGLAYHSLDGVPEDNCIYK